MSRVTREAGKRDMSLVNVPHRGMLDNLSRKTPVDVLLCGRGLCFCLRLGENAPSSNIYAASRFVISPQDIYVGLRARQRHCDTPGTCVIYVNVWCRTRETRQDVRPRFSAYDMWALADKRRESVSLTAQHSEDFHRPSPESPGFHFSSEWWIWEKCSASTLFWITRILEWYRIPFPSFLQQGRK